MIVRARPIANRSGNYNLPRLSRLLKSGYGTTNRRWCLSAVACLSDEGYEKMPGLLVSVRNVEEAVDALAGGAAIIDVKEPNRGSLGAADPHQWQAVFNRVQGLVPVSIALGELLDRGLNQRSQFVPPVAFAKVGLAGCRHRSGWARQWKQVLQRLPNNVRSVATIYADWQAAQAPHPLDTIQAASDLGCAAVLFDTCFKQHGWLLDHLPDIELRKLLDAVRKAGMKVVLAGSITRIRLPAVAAPHRT